MTSREFYPEMTRGKFSYILLVIFFSFQVFCSYNFNQKFEDIIFQSLVNKPTICHLLDFCTFLVFTRRRTVLRFFDDVYLESVHESCFGVIKIEPNSVNDGAAKTHESGNFTTQIQKGKIFKNICSIISSKVFGNLSCFKWKWNFFHPFRLRYSHKPFSI